MDGIHWMLSKNKPWNWKFCPKTTLNCCAKRCKDEAVKHNPACFLKKTKTGCCSKKLKTGCCPKNLKTGLHPKNLKTGGCRKKIENWMLSKKTWILDVVEEKLKTGFCLRKPGYWMLSKKVENWLSSKKVENWMLSKIWQKKRKFLSGNALKLWRMGLCSPLLICNLKNISC